GGVLDHDVGVAGRGRGVGGRAVGLAQGAGRHVAGAVGVGAIGRVAVAERVAEAAGGHGAARLATLAEASRAAGVLGVFLPLVVERFERGVGRGGAAGQRAGARLLVDRGAAGLERAVGVGAIGRVAVAERVAEAAGGHGAARLATLAEASRAAGVLGVFLPLVVERFERGVGRGGAAGQRAGARLLVDRGAAGLERA